MKKYISYYLLFVILIGLASCNRVQYPNAYQTKTTEISSQYASDIEMQALIQPYKDSLDATMNEKIGYFSHDMFKKKPESELGNFMTNAMLVYYLTTNQGNLNSTVAFTNYGGIRVQSISKGDVKLSAMFELMPFENQVVNVQVTGNVLLSVFQKIASFGGAPVSHNVQLTIQNDNLKEVSINGKKIEATAIYNFITTDYVANGGDGMAMLIDKPRTETNLLLRDVLIEYVKNKQLNGEQIEAPLTGRITIIE